MVLNNRKYCGTLQDDTGYLAVGNEKLFVKFLKKIAIENNQKQNENRNPNNLDEGAAALRLAHEHGK